MSKLDCIYIAASPRDMRFTRICVASIRYFYPDVPIRLLMGRLNQEFADELKQYWGVELADIPHGEYGWGYISYMPMFAKPGERSLYMDSDTIMAGPVLDWAEQHNEDFIIDDEIQPPEVAKSMYLDVEQSIADGTPIPEPEFLFNIGHYFCTAGTVTRADFDGLVRWGFPTRIVNPRVFKQESQGVFNFVVNRRYREGTLTVARVPMMYWPGRGMQGVDPARIIARKNAPLIIHWAGLKKARLASMPGTDLLEYFEKLYYTRIPGGELKRHTMAVGHALTHWWHEVRIRFGLRKRIITRKLQRLGLVSEQTDTTANVF